MTTLIRRCTLIALSALLTLSGAALAAINHDFDVTDGGKLVVEAEGARLNVRGGSGNQVRVAISRGSDDADEIEDDYDIEFSQRGDRVTVTLKHRRGWSFSNWFPKSLVVEVDLPTRFDVDLRSSGGSVTVRDLIGNVRARTSGGSVTVYLERSIAVALDARASGGRVHNDLPIALQGSTSKSKMVGNINGGGPKLTLRSSGGSVNVHVL